MSLLPGPSIIARHSGASGGQSASHGSQGGPVADDFQHDDTSHNQRAVSERNAAANGDFHSNAQPRRHTRVRSGCLTCRRRRVKCDEQHPVCRFCARLDMQCIWKPEDATTSPLSATAGEDPAKNDGSGHSGNVATRKRARKACEQCRKAKLGCSAEKPICSNCKGKGGQCTYDETDTTSAVHGTPSARTTSLRGHTADSESCYINTSANIDTRPPSILPESPAAGSGDVKQLAIDIHRLSKISLNEMVEIYFERVYNCSWHAYIHRPTFMEALESHKVPSYLLHSMCAAAAVFTHSDMAAVAPWESFALTSVMNSIVQPCLEQVQCLLNLCFVAISRAKATNLWMQSGIAMRIATGLRLHLDSSKANDTESLKETRRRIMWACFCYDSLVSSGIKEFEQFPLHAIRIDLPSNERNFAFSIHEPTRQLDVRDYLHSTRHVTSAEGILSHHVALMAIRAATMRYIVNLSTQDAPPWQPDSEYERCRLQLLAWEDDLPAQLHFNRSNMAARKQSGQLSHLVALHMRRHGISLSLRRIAIYGFIESARPEILLSAPRDWIRAAQGECVAHAEALSEVALTVFKAYPSFVLDDPGVLTPMYESLRVQAWAMQHLTPREAQMTKASAAGPAATACLKLLLRSVQMHNVKRRFIPLLSRLHQTTHLGLLIGTPEWQASGQITPHESEAYPHVRESVDHSIIARITEELARDSAGTSRQQSLFETNLRHDSTAPVSVETHTAVMSTAPQTGNPFNWNSSGQTNDIFAQFTGGTLPVQPVPDQSRVLDSYWGLSNEDYSLLNSLVNDPSPLNQHPEGDGQFTSNAAISDPLDLMVDPAFVDWPWMASRVA